MIVYKYNDKDSIQKVKTTIIKRDKLGDRTIIKDSFVLTQDRNLVNLLKLKNIYPIVVNI